MRRFGADYHRRLAAGDLSKCEPEGIGSRFAAACEDQFCCSPPMSIRPGPRKSDARCRAWWSRFLSISRTRQRTSPTLMPPTAQCHPSCWRGLLNCAGFAPPEQGGLSCRSGKNLRQGAIRRQKVVGERANATGGHSTHRLRGRRNSHRLDSLYRLDPLIMKMEPCDRFDAIARVARPVVGWPT
jgi:hypothetical protein